LRIVTTANKSHGNGLSGVYGAVITCVGDFKITCTSLSDGAIPTRANGVCIFKSGGPIGNSNITCILNGDEPLHARAPRVID
jgi:hypothetical protein